MIFSQNCFLTDRCNKYCNDKSCQKQNRYCPKLWKQELLFDESLLTWKQRFHKDLFIDKDGTDKQQFLQLKQIEENIKKFVKQGKNLYIHSSNTGNGKTEWSIRLIQAYIDDIWAKSDLTCRAMFINVPRYFLELKSSISHSNDYIQKIKDNVLNADLVVFDEIATKNITEFQSENLYSIVNTRLDDGKSNVFTSNMNSNEIATLMGDRLASRILNLSIDIEFKGKDKRSLGK